MSGFNLVIFDCDGVLIDSELLATRAWVNVLAGLGHVVDPLDFMQRYVGISSGDMHDDLAQRYGVLPADLDVQVTTRRRDLFERELKAMPGIEHVIGSLPIPCCVASGSSPERLEHSLGLTGLSQLFPGSIFSSSMVARGKPAPDLFLFAAERCGVAANRCLVIEDSVPGVQAAVAAGMTVIGFVGGEHCQEQHADKLLANGASAVISSWEQFSSTFKDVATV